jgi:hypothetical protein
MSKKNRNFFYYLEEEERKDEQPDPIPLSEVEINALCEIYGLHYANLFNSVIKVIPAGNSHYPYSKVFEALPYKFFSLETKLDRDVITFWAINDLAPKFKGSLLNMNYNKGLTNTAKHYSLTLYAQFFSIDGEKFVDAGVAGPYIYTKAFRNDGQIVYRFLKSFEMFRHSCVNPLPDSAIIDNMHSFSVRIQRKSDNDIVFFLENELEHQEKILEPVQRAGIVEETSFDKIFGNSEGVFLMDTHQKIAIFASDSSFKILDIPVDDNIYSIHHLETKGDSEVFLVVTDSFELSYLALSKDTVKLKPTKMKLRIPENDSTINLMNSRKYVLQRIGEHWVIKYYAEGSFYYLDLATEKEHRIANVEQYLENSFFFAWNCDQDVVYFLNNHVLHLIDEAGNHSQFDIFKEDFDPTYLDILPSDDHLFIYSYDEDYQTLLLQTMTFESKEGRHQHLIPELAFTNLYKLPQKILTSDLE